ncbi:unnamed protein product [Cuscuta epithymum]|uniref:Uncharacterized protein n=1 Tax=Cuscuta epithymum TaxID=186058 RepID=A0AAV0CE23_9ASTE|nr:unnamed protein product [Cuscuta epithymum]
MNCLFWNTRGLESSSSKINSLVKQWRIHLLIIIEPMVDNIKIDMNKWHLGWEGALCSSVNKIWIFWDTALLNISDILWHTQLVHFEVTGDIYKGWVTGVYGRHTHVVRKELWENLCSFSNNMIEPWMVGVKVY